MEYDRVAAFDAVDDDVFAHGKTAKARTQIGIAPSSHVRVLRQQQEPVCKGVNQSAGDLHAAALEGDIKPDTIKFGYRFR